MPTEFFYPISAVTHDLPSGYDAWSGTGGNKNSAARPTGGRTGPMVHDDATTSISSPGTVPAAQALNTDWPSPVGSISGITLAMRDTSGGFRERRCYFVNASGTPGTIVHDVGDITGYRTVGPSDASGARPGGGSWVASDVADDKTTFLAVDHIVGTGGVSVTSVWGELTYVTPSGGFVPLFYSLPFVGLLLNQVDMDRVLEWRRLYHPRHTILTELERDQAWRELKEYRNPTFFFLGGK